MTCRQLTARWLGRVDYEVAWKMQHTLMQERIEGRIGDTVLLLEHTPVITMGRGADRAHIVASSEVLAREGIQVHETERGGDVTYHGPGQLVAYPIVDLKPDRCDVRAYVRSLSRVMSEVLRSEGVESGHLSDFIGVWVQAEASGAWPWSENVRSTELGSTQLAKIGAIGVKLSRWVTMHGFALNLCTKLEHFGYIVPCGISEHPMTSLEALTGKKLDVRMAAQRAALAFGREWGAEVAWEDAACAAD